MLQVEDVVDEKSFTAIIAEPIGSDTSNIIITTININKDLSTTLDYKHIFKGTEAVSRQ